MPKSFLDILLELKYEYGYEPNFDVTKQSLRESIQMIYQEFKRYKMEDEVTTLYENENKTIKERLDELLI